MYMLNLKKLLKKRIFKFLWDEEKYMKLIEKSQNFNLNGPINLIQPILSPFVLYLTSFSIVYFF